MSAQMYFPQQFSWGAATSAYQIEGGWDADGKGPSVWDVMTHNRPETIKTKENGDISCDSYHKIEKDLNIIKELGIDSYRFSVSWSRILPDGTKSRVNKNGIAYYNKLIDGLVDIGVQPVLTMHHFDLPQALQDDGGWLNARIVQNFTDYADILYEHFGDRVKMWITINEPWVVCILGYQEGMYPPNEVNQDANMYRAGHNMILAHASAYRLYEKKYKEAQIGKVGIALNSQWAVPKNKNDPTHVEAAERALLFELGWFAQPIFLDGHYPEVMVTRIGKDSCDKGMEKSKLPAFTKDEQLLVTGSSDFLGLNYYSTHHCCPLSNMKASFISLTGLSVKLAGWLKHRGVETGRDSHWPETTIPWLRSCPFGLGQMLKHIDSWLNKIPVYITENGTVDMSGRTDDDHRVLYYKEHLREVSKAISEHNCNIKGYFAWSLMDNYEWCEGYSQKFGLHYVDFKDPERPRIPKSSAKFYAKVIQAKMVE